MEENLKMTFKEYCEQAEKPIKKPNVLVSRSDVFHSWSVLPYDAEEIELVIDDTHYVYLKPSGSNDLYTMDSDGNKKYLSCFKLIEE